MSLLHRARKTGTRWVAVFSYCLIPSAAALAMPPAAPVLTETVVTEPIFRGKVHVFTAGPEAAPPVVLVHGLGDKAARD